MSPAALALSVDLTKHLRAWYDFWAAHLDPVEGWDTPEAEASWLVEGERIEALLRDEIRDVGSVSSEWRDT